MKKSYIRDTDHVIFEDGTVINNLGNKVKPWVEANTGYILIRPERRGTCYRLHRILAEAFIPNPDNKPFVLHKNDIKSDNSLANLYWGTNSENTKQGYENNCYRFKRRSYSLKATHRENKEIQVFTSLRSAAETLQLNRKNIASILRGDKINTYEYDFEYLMPND